MDIIHTPKNTGSFGRPFGSFLKKKSIPYVDEWEEAGIVPKSVWRKMGEQGFLCMDVPEEYGGAGGGFPLFRDL